MTQQTMKERTVELRDDIGMMTRYNKASGGIHERKHIYEERVVAYQGLIDILTLSIGEDPAIGEPLNNAIQRARIKVEVNELTEKKTIAERILKEYNGRIEEWETWFEPKAAEMEANFEEVLKKAKLIPDNVRLIGQILRWEKESKEHPEEITQQTKLEFFLFLKQEMLNFEKSGKKLPKTV